MVSACIKTVINFAFALVVISFYFVGSSTAFAAVAGVQSPATCQTPVKGFVDGGAIPHDGSIAMISVLAGDNRLNDTGNYMDRFRFRGHYGGGGYSGSSNFNPLVLLLAIIIVAVIYGIRYLLKL